MNSHTRQGINSRIVVRRGTVLVPGDGLKSRLARAG
jgi:hypothetical protein